MLAELQRGPDECPDPVSILERIQVGPGANPVKLRREKSFSRLLALDLPERVGGANLPPLEMADIFRRAGTVDLELRDSIGAGHARFLTLVPTRRFDGLLRGVASGTDFCAVAITEPNVGSDLHALETTARPDAEGYVLNGIKQHVSRVSESSHFIVFAAVPGRAGEPLITAFLVPADANGVLVEPGRPMGMANVSWGRVHLKDVRVPREHRIGGEGQAISLFVKHFAYWRTMMAAAAVGSAQATVERAIDRMQQRGAFGGPIGRFTHLQQGLAENVARLRMAWLLVQNVAGEFTDRRWPIFDAAMAKAEALEAAIAATDWCMRVFGAAGYDIDNGIEKRHRDILGLRVADGTTDVLRGQVARAILGDTLYELSLNRIPKDKIMRLSERRRFW